MSVHCYLLLAAMFATSLTGAGAKNVIFFPPPFVSYISYHSNVAAELASLGNDVWLCVPHYLMKENLVKDKSVHIFDYGDHLGDVTAMLLEKTQIVDNFWAGEHTNEACSFYEVCKEMGEVSSQVLADESFVNKVRSLKPDLIVLESIPFNLNMVVLPYMLDIPYAFIGTIHDVVLSKVPFSPNTPIFITDRMSDRMSFFQRMKNLLFYIARINFDLFYDSSLVSKFAPHKPYKSINELAANAEIFIAEVDHVLDYPRVTFPNTKLIGGSSASAAKPLDGEYKNFVDRSNNGIIVFTFGGDVVDIPPPITSKLLSAFKQLDLGVIWKVNITSPDPTRILTSKWIPQNDLLGHEKTKLFISHCGKNGQYEALYHGVPILCLPIFGDQDYNAERIVVKELGLRADMREASADELAAMMKQIVYEGKYSENMKKASRLYRELYKNPKKEAAFWLDHVMQYGGAYMRSTGQDMSWYQIYLLDVIAFLAAVILVVILIVYSLITCCYKYCTSARVKPEAKKHKKQ